MRLSKRVQDTFAMFCTGVPTARKWFGPDVNAKRKHYIGITMLTLTQDLLEELRNRVPEFPDIASGVFIHKIIISSPAHR